jgi:diguanylate cyclase (GGDEF)-like protein/PAS domain S-box-containing protein
MTTSSLHSLLKKQLARAQASDPQESLAALAAMVNSVYEDHDRDRRRTERSMTLMIDELSEARALIEATFESIQQGVMMVDAAGKVRLFNRQVCRLLSIPPEVLAARPDYHLLNLPHAPETGDRQSREIVTAEGKRVEILESALRNGGFVQTYLDVTRRHQRETEIVRAHAEFRALFENAVVGIYRSDLRGRPTRVNPAFARLHGFDTPEDFLREVAGDGFEKIHPDKTLRTDFLRRIAAEGRVTDLTWKIRNLKTGEYLWVTETAWTVAGADGWPAHIEGTVVDATTERIAQRRVTYLAHHDPLTGLANREVFNKELAQRLDPSVDNRPMALHCIDLDRFKMVNDTMGHPCGDALLQMVSSRLQKVTHGRGLAARLGGDEFAFVQTGPVGRVAAMEVAEQIRTALNEPYEIEGKLVHAGATIGVALAPEHATDSEDLFRNADLALCHGKSQRRGHAHLFDAAVAEEIISRRLLETELRMAWANKDFYLVFQPIIDVSKGAPSSFEALIRWNRRSRPPISPGQFIPVAEEIGLISEMGDFVLKEACRRLSEYDNHTSISVNVSTVQFRDRSIIRSVRDALAGARLGAHRLVIEITETLLLENDESTRECMDALHKMGVRIALDDFGIGYSALSYLTRFKFSEVKIDRAFVASLEANPANASIIQAILHIGKNMSMVIVAEGVETFTQAESLRAMGCLNFQGYLFGKPARELLSAIEPRRFLCA